MATRRDATGQLLEREVERALRAEPRVLLAVSGGRDSMALLEAAARVAPERVAAIATFDHGTGAEATRAAALVARRGAELGLRVERGVMPVTARERRSEAAWRAARWSFLRDAAASLGAVVATAHTRDDQVETVLMRAMRGAGARGLAGLYAPRAGVIRPLLGLPRAVVAAYAERVGARWVEDPSNADQRFLRNRVRLDLLPALERARPGFGDSLLDLARRAAAWRAEVNALVARALPHRVEGGALTVARADVLRYGSEWLGLVWPALAARVGVTLDRRGTSRLAAFTIDGAAGGRIQLAGGHHVILHRDQLQLRRAPTVSRPPGAVACDAQPLTESLTFAAWHFRRDGRAPGDDRWSARLPSDRRLTVRRWRPGDRMVPAGAGDPRRVKGLLRAAGVAGADRPEWPVVLADDEIVWVPGVRRARAAQDLAEGEGSVFVCERIDRRTHEPHG